MYTLCKPDQMLARDSLGAIANSGRDGDGEGSLTKSNMGGAGGRNETRGISRAALEGESSPSLRGRLANIYQALGAVTGTLKMMSVDESRPLDGAGGDANIIINTSSDGRMADVDRWRLTA